MNTKYCQSCGGKALPTLRMCPSCGSRNFDLTPPTQASAAQPFNQKINTSGSTVSATSSSSQTASNSHQNSTRTYNLIPAPLGPRFIAYIIDAIILAILSAIPVTVAYFLTLPYRDSDFSLAVSLGVIAAYLIPFVYHTVLPASESEATYGKKVMGLKIVTLQGERLSKSQAFVRILLIMLLPLLGVIAVSISFGGMAIGYKDSLAASIGIAWILTVPIVLAGPYLTIFFNPQKQTLYDIIVKTIVIKG